MREQLKVGYLRDEDQRTFIEWVNSTPGNLWDPSVLKYPTLKVICAYNGAPVAFLPVQQVLMLESLAVSEKAPLLDKAQAFRDLVKAAELHASSTKLRELYFICKDEDVLKVAEGHGFERIEFPVVRMRL
ncbi:MAG TPA: hypothetical protein VF748_16070 [Candidatus Acidoferrum sp.]